jgi:hypothetical protein
LDRATNKSYQIAVCELVGDEEGGQVGVRFKRERDVVLDVIGI